MRSATAVLVTLALVSSLAAQAKADIAPATPATKPATFHSLKELLDTVPYKMWPGHLYGPNTVDAKGRWVGGDFNLDDIQMQLALDRILAINGLLAKNAVGAAVEMDLQPSAVHELQEKVARMKSDRDLQILQNGRGSADLSLVTVISPGIAPQYKHFPSNVSALDRSGWRLPYDTPDPVPLFDYKEFTSAAYISEVFDPDQLEQIAKMERPEKINFTGTIGKISLALRRTGTTTEGWPLSDQQKSRGMRRDQGVFHSFAAAIIRIDVLDCKIDSPTQQQSASFIQNALTKTPSTQPDHAEAAPVLESSKFVLAKLWFKEDMGYTVGTLAKGAPSHTDNTNAFDEVSDALVGKSYTLVVTNHSSPVRIRFLTTGKVYLLAGTHSRDSELAALAKVAHRETTLTATDNTVWSITADAGTGFVIPFQVALIAESLEKG